MQKTNVQKETKLATQIGKVTAVILVLVFAMLIIVTVILASNAVNTAVSHSLTEKSDNTGNQLESIFQATAMTVDDMEGYLQKAYKMSAQGLSNMAGEVISAEDSRGYKSIIYGTEISELSADVEKYIIETARATVIGDNSIVGMKALFEPYKFDVKLKDYSFYINTDTANAEKVESFGSYEEYSQKDYYKQARDLGKAVFTDPYEYNGEMLISCAMPILYDNEVQGVIVADVKSDDFAKFITLNPQYPSMYITIYNANYIDIYDSDSADDVGRSMDEFYKNAKELQSIKDETTKGEAFTAITTRENGTKVVRYFSPIKVGTETWWSMTALSKSDRDKESVQMAIIMLVISILSLGVIVCAVVFTLRKKLKPIDNVVEAAEQIAKGNLDAVISVQTTDEIGKLGGAFQYTIHGLKKIISDIDFLLSTMADGNFAVKSKQEEAYVGDYRNILLSVEKLNTNLSNTIRQIVDASEQVSIGSGQMAESAQSLAEGATEQAGAVEELTATIEDVSSAAEVSAEQAEKAYEQSKEFAEEAEHSSEEMERLDQAMNRISETSKQIEQIIEQIEEIASQTNLLSLNASIEAARAGEAGRGFAVVADQIGKLASDSAQSAVNTRELISKSLEEIKAGNEITVNTSKSLLKVIDGIKILARSSKDTSDMSVAQAETLKQVQIGIEQISNVVQSNSAAAQETSATSEELSAQAESLNSLVGKFELDK